MSSDRLRQVEDLYNAAMSRPAAQRIAFMLDACPNDTSLRDDVLLLVSHAESAGSEHVEPLVPGQLLGPYVLAERIGAGGMGEVYRARDTRLDRDVAIKLLPERVRHDPARLACLQREARVVASLNNPHIAAIHGVEEAVGVLGLVFEFVEGETLAERLARRAGSPRSALCLQDAVSYAGQIADALEAAHRRGVIHRDLKPANVKISPDGILKLLDFGIATVVTCDAQGIDVTRTEAAARAGLIIGTAGYMSPEQARGHPVDPRTDIWAFGCVLYEMLSGRMAFKGDTVSDTIAAILDRDPDWSILPRDTPRAIRRLLRRCLDKDPRQRLRDIGDARIELDDLGREAAEETDDPAAGPLRARAWRTRARLAAATTLVLALSAIGWYLFAPVGDGTAPGDRRVRQYTIDVPKRISQAFNGSVALSPDGSLLAYSQVPGPIMIRQLDSDNVHPLETSDPSEFYSGPLFSPDGAFLLYVSGNAIYSSKRLLQKAPIIGGLTETLAKYDMFHRGDWSDDGWLYWTARYPGGIVRIRDGAFVEDTFQQVTTLDVAGGERSHRFAHLLPGGDALIYTVGFEGIDSYYDARIDVWDMRNGQSKTIIQRGTSAVYSAGGFIVYAHAGKLMAVPFDLQRREVTGSAFEVEQGVMMSRNTGAAHFTMSRQGDLAYVPGPSEAGRRTLVWVDRSGNEEPFPVLSPASYLYPRLSPDGQTLAVEIEGPSHDFYLYDFQTTVFSRITTDGLSHDPVWSHNGTRLAFRSWRDGGMTMWSMPTDQSAGPERLDPVGTRQSPVSFSPDGRFLAFDQKDPVTQDDACVLSLDGSRTSRPFVQTTSGEGSMKFSPDGGWVAYSSNQSGQPEIYVQAFPGPGLKKQISTNGGVDPVWRRSGGELYYRAENKMMAVSVTTSPQFTAGTPKELWERSYSQGSGSSCGMPGVGSSNYDVTADGQRFLMVRDEDAAYWAGQIVVVINWVEKVKNIERARTQAARSLSAK